MSKQYKILPKNTPSKQTFVSCFQFLLLKRLLSGIKCSLELRAGAGKAVNWTGQPVRLKKYVIALHYSSWGKTLQVNQKGLEKHSGKYTPEHTPEH